MDRSRSSWPRSHGVPGGIHRPQRAQLTSPASTATAQRLRRRWWALPQPRRPADGLPMSSRRCFARRSSSRQVLQYQARALNGGLRPQRRQTRSLRRIASSVLCLPPAGVAAVLLADPHRFEDGATPDAWLLGMVDGTIDGSALRAVLPRTGARDIREGSATGKARLGDQGAHRSEAPRVASGVSALRRAIPLAWPALITVKLELLAAPLTR